jgi:hypothetical protein
VAATRVEPHSDGETRPGGPSRPAVGTTPGRRIWLSARIRRRDQRGCHGDGRWTQDGRCLARGPRHRPPRARILTLGRATSATADQATTGQPGSIAPNPARPHAGTRRTCPGSAAVRTRAAIVEAATVLFLRHGYQGTAVEDITRRRSCLTTTGHRSPLVSGGCGVLEPTTRGRCGGQRIGRQLALYVDRPSLPNRDREQEPCPRTTAHPVPHRPGPRSPLGHKCPGHPVANPPEARRARNSRLARSTSRSTR